MRQFTPLLLCIWPCFAAPLHAAGLPDTGRDICYSDTAADGVAASNPGSIARDAGTHPRQDCRYGWDPAAAAGALTKAGGGAKGFDYTKIANNGAALGAGATLGTAPTDWACTQDNITGLTWEVKTATSTDLRYSGHTYAWLSNVSTTNGGNIGGAGTNTCNGTLPGDQCNTEAFAAAVNAGAGLCGQTDWRLPTRRELVTLVHFDVTNPSIDPVYFPNTVASGYWSGSTYAVSPSGAWVVDFVSNGTAFNQGKPGDHPVRLVRGGPF